MNMNKKCINIENNLKKCTCTYLCSIKGKCCDCLNNHRKYNELPAFFFPPEIERTYDRTIKKFLSIKKNINY